MTLRFSAIVLMLACGLGAPVAANGDSSARTLFERAMSRERAIRDADQDRATVADMRRVISAYENVVRRFPASGYSDNALWQAGNLAWLAFQRFGDTHDRDAAIKYLTRLKREYPTSSLRSGADEVLRAASAVAAEEKPAAVGLTSQGESPDEKAIGTSALANDVQGDTPGTTPIVIRDIKRMSIADGMRVTIEMDSETTFRAERLENPRRVFFDLKGTRPVPALLDATIRFSDDIVREIRLGRHPNSTTRIVFDMEGVDTYSVFTLYNPYRLVIDFKPVAGAAVTSGQKPSPVGVQQGTSGVRAARRQSLPELKSPTKLEKEALKELAVAPVVIPAPASTTQSPPLLMAAVDASVGSSSPSSAVPSANMDGKFSLARQLGLGVARIVIDAGHGGHDPGAQGNGVNESELTLDVAARLTRLLQKQPGVEVVMTRDTDVFVPLEERTAIANREGADLFLSIHANASRNPKAHGVETYFLNFATNPDAEAVAARENSTSGRAMHSLPDIVKAIALNNKIDESRDFADIVQRSMVRKLGPRNKQLRDLGVKQAPFVVLIGASMPSVLAEISFVTHRQEGTLLKSTAYRQQIAEALFEAVV
ncbi:MAG: N-acetylmuramoyl-L-alanine amidase, partial [Acidobacteria bacterium]|nr:N-acetylmuramoyl-L-alanine amidase [Acidobacteriota bacterium]